MTGVIAEIVAIVIIEAGIQTTRGWYEYTMPVSSVDWKLQARPFVASCAVNGRDNQVRR